MAAASAAATSTVYAGPGPGPGPTHADNKSSDTSLFPSAATKSNTTVTVLNSIPNFKRRRSIPAGVTACGNRWTDGGVSIKFMTRAIFPFLEMMEGIKVLPLICRHWRWLMTHETIFFASCVLKGRNTHIIPDAMTECGNLCSKLVHFWVGGKRYGILSTERNWTPSMSQMVFPLNWWSMTVPKLTTLVTTGVDVAWSDELISQLPSTLERLGIGSGGNRNWKEKKTHYLDFHHLLTTLPKLVSLSTLSIDVIVCDKQQLFRHDMTVSQISTVLDDKRHKPRKWTIFQVVCDISTMNPLAMFVHVTRNPSRLTALSIRNKATKECKSPPAWKHVTCEMFCEAAETLFCHGKKLAQLNFSIPQLGSVPYLLARVANSVIAKSLRYFTTGMRQPVQSSWVANLTHAMPALSHFPAVREVVVQIDEQTSISDQARYWTALCEPERKNTLRNLSISKSDGLLCGLTQDVFQDIIRTQMQSLCVVLIDEIPWLNLGANLTNEIINKIGRDPTGVTLKLKVDCLVSSTECVTLALTKGYHIGNVQGLEGKHLDQILQNPVAVDMSDIFRRSRPNAFTHLLACVIDYKDWDTLNCDLKQMTFLLTKDAAAVAVPALKRCAKNTDMYIYSNSYGDGRLVRIRIVLA